MCQQIQTVQNVIQGRAASLLEFRASTGKPVESYKLIVLSLDMDVLDLALLAKLAPYTPYCPPEPEDIIRQCEAFLEKKKPQSRR